MKNHSPFLVCDYNIKSVKEDDPNFYIIEGYASVYGNVDSYRDIVNKGAFTKDLIKNGNSRPILWQHRSDKPIGIGLFEEADQGLKCTIKMPKESIFVKTEIMPMVKCGAVKGLSIGYFTEKEEYDSGTNINNLIELKLRETSIVTFPANELAQITAAKQFLGIEEDSDREFKMYPFADIETEWNEKEAIENIKKNTNSENEPSKNYSIAFMDITDPKSKSFDDYKMPYMKCIDGKFKIIPKALYSIVGSLVKSKNVSSLFKRHINELYKKLGQEEPFKSNNVNFIDLATFKNIDKKDLDIIFDNEHVVLSTNTKNYIINSLCSHKNEDLVNDTDNNNLMNELKNLKEIMGE